MIDVVAAEMEKYEPGEYTDGVLESVRVLRDQSTSVNRTFLEANANGFLLVMPNFAERIKIAIDTLRTRLGHDDSKVKRTTQLRPLLFILSISVRIE